MYVLASVEHVAQDVESVVCLRLPGRFPPSLRMSPMT